MVFSFLVGALIGFDPVLHRMQLGPLLVKELLAASRKSLNRLLAGDL
jgi:hypothetical protein